MEDTSMPARSGVVIPAPSEATLPAQQKPPIKIQVTRGFIDLVHEDEKGGQINTKLTHQIPYELPDTEINRKILHPYLKKGLINIKK